MIFYMSYCFSFSEPTRKKCHLYIWDAINISDILFAWLMDKCVSSNIPIKMFAYAGAHFVPIAYPYSFVKLLCGSI